MLPFYLFCFFFFLILLSYLILISSHASCWAMVMGFCAGELFTHLKSDTTEDGDVFSSMGALEFSRLDKSWKKDMTASSG